MNNLVGKYIYCTTIIAPMDIKPKVCRICKGSLTTKSGWFDIIDLLYRIVKRLLARKIVNCFRLYQDLREFVDNSDDNSPFTSKLTTIEDAQAAETNMFTHERSPTGTSPSTKRQKRPQMQELILTPKILWSKKSLFGNGETRENTGEYENVDDVFSYELWHWDYGREKTNRNAPKEWKFIPTGSSLTDWH